MFKKRELGTYPNGIPKRKIGFYEKHIKRVFDIMSACAALIAFGWLYILIAILVKLKLGSPVLFTQDRPGLINPSTGEETIFKMYKFRTMTDERDENGELLPDDIRLTKFGAWLRNSSLDELPEAFNILNGTMSVIGPRPQLVRDMVFMTPEQRARHTAKPGLSGLAQVRGRNAISWEGKLSTDLEYIKKVTFIGDVKIVLETVVKAFIKQEGADSVAEEQMDYGDYLLKNNIIDSDEYETKRAFAKKILYKTVNEDLVSIIMPSYNTADYIYESIQSVINQTYTNWELIIVDDCSTDNTDDVVREVNDPRIKYFKNECNSGAAVTRNFALRKASGRWIAFLDSDDLWCPQKLEKQISFMKENHYSFSYTNYEEIDGEGNRTGVKVTGPKKITKTGMYNYCWPGCLTVMYDANAIGLVQIADIKKNNDYAMWLKISQIANCYLLNECLALYRKGRTGSVSSHSIATMIGWHYKLYYDAENLGTVESIINTVRNMVFGLYKKNRYVTKTYNANAVQFKKISDNNDGLVLYNIVICYKNEDEILEYAKEIAKQSVHGRIQLVIVINAINRGVKYLSDNIETLGIKYSIVDPGENLGYLNGLVYGYSSIIDKKKWIIFSNTDIKFETSTVIESFLTTNYEDSIWMVGPSIYAPYTKHYCNPYNIYRPVKKSYQKLSIIMRFPHLFHGLYLLKHKLKGYKSPDNHSISMYIYGIHGSFMFIKSDLIDELLKREKWELLYDEEPYLAEITRNNNKSVFYDSELSVIHLEGASTGSINITNRYGMMKKSTDRILEEFY